MLVHKETMGVLNYYWDGQFVHFNQKMEPKMIAATPNSCGLNMSEWWEIPNGTTLANKIEQCYPYCDPVVVEGELVNIEVWPAWKRYGDEPPEESANMQADIAHKRRKKYNRRKTPMLSCGG